MDDKGNGNLIIKNINEGVVITQTYNNSVFNSKVQSLVDNSASKLCQREAGETYGNVTVEKQMIFVMILFRQ